jgi:hypothetical protein
MDLMTLGGMAKAMEEKKNKTIKALRELADAIEYGDFVVDEFSISSESKNFSVEQCTYEISGFRQVDQ